MSKKSDSKWLPYFSGNKETSPWDETKDWEGVSIPAPIRAQ
jgi:hypothetical protein